MAVDNANLYENIKRAYRELKEAQEQINLGDFGHVVELADLCLRRLRSDTLARA